MKIMMQYYHHNLMLIHKEQKMFCTILFPIIYKSIFNFLQSSMLSFYSIAYWTNNTNRSVIVIIKHFIPFVLKINWIGNCFKSWSEIINNFFRFLNFLYDCLTKWTYGLFDLLFLHFMFDCFLLVIYSFL